ncbi:MAG: hypothetical protein HY587_04885 [Candidatus Omnitrophica bacterium]|nr:hypothetical protein [Candidatus Omnitrophota bacterium]
MKPLNLLKFLLFIAVMWGMATNFCLALDREFMYDSADRRDPFLSLFTDNVEVSDLEELSVEGVKLEGIIFDPLQGSLAIVNGEIYRISDFIGGFEIKEIGSNFVKIAKGDILYTIKLPSDETKTKTEK